MNLISIVIPVYKSSRSLEIIVQQIDELQKQTGQKFELIFVNDSPFHIVTGLTLEELKKNHNYIKVLYLRKNEGQHVALLIGLKEATGQYVVTMDDDLQHPVSEIPKLIEAIKKNNIDAVFGVSGYSNKMHSLWRNAGSILINIIDNYFLKKPKGLIKSPFRIMTHDIAKLIVKNYNASPSVSSLIINITNNIINIEVGHARRVYGKSNYTLKKLISHTLNNLLHYSSWPLKLVGFIGLAGFVFSLAFILIIFLRKALFDVVMPGYASTVTLISFFGGLTLFSLGLIGEYLIRIIKEQQKPDLDDLVR